MWFFKRIDKTNEQIESFFDTVDQALLVFKQGVKNYLYSETGAFNDNLASITKLESDAELMRREIESGLYSRTSYIRMRGDVMRLLERMGHIVDLLNDNLYQFDIERPYIPAELNADIQQLTELSTQAVETTIPAAKAYFRDPDSVPDKISRTYFYEKEAVKYSQTIKRTVFHNMASLKLSEKFHLRYFALHIENLAKAAENVADQLAVMAIRRTF